MKGLKSREGERQPESNQVYVEVNVKQSGALAGTVVGFKQCLGELGGITIQSAAVPMHQGLTEATSAVTT